MNHFGYAALVDALLPKLRSQVEFKLKKWHIYENARG